MAHRALQARNLAEAGFEDEALLLALPKELFVLFGERTEELIVVRRLVDQILGVVLHGFAVGEQARPHRRPGRMDDLAIGHVGAE